ncbi:MAG: hypothetical protein RJR37_04395 [Peptococcaceae bacterium MAG4]|nr:hypothetical protein [Peptococcaceae bacterium MAG4]
MHLPIQRRIRRASVEQCLPSKTRGFAGQKMGRGNSYGLNRFFAQLSRPGIQLS